MAGNRSSSKRTLRGKLLDILVERSYRSADEPVFRLASGKLSTYYVDCRATTMYARAMPLIGELFLRALPTSAQAVGGLTMGADPIANAIACCSGSRRRKIDAFSVRKEPKKHGLGKWIEGCVSKGSKVVVVEDVVTTGGSTIDAIRRCREEGLEVVGVVALIDREEDDGIGAIGREAGRRVPVRAIFTRSELEAASARVRRGREPARRPRAVRRRTRSA